LRGDWPARVRAAWQQEHLDAVVALARAGLRAGRADRAIAPLTALVAQRPLDESLAAMLMRVLHATHRSADAPDEYAGIAGRPAAEIEEVRRARRRPAGAPVTAGGELGPQDVDAVVTAPELARVLRALRRRQARERGGKELSYRELATRAGWSFGVVGHYFNGEVLPPTHRFDALVRMLGATPVEQGRLATARDRVAEHQRAAHQPAAPAAETAAAGAVVAPRPAQLPLTVAQFTGRAAELHRLDLLLPAPGTPPVTAPLALVTGSPGIGKTTLAVQWAHRVSHRFPDGQLYVNLRGFDPAAAPVDPAQALRGFLQAFAVPIERIPVELDAQAALYRSLLAGKRVLVVLDNARDGEQVRPLLPAVPGCLAVVTSRDQLTGLIANDGAHPITVSLPTAGEARQLLSGRLGAGRVAAEPDAVDEIIDLAGRLPLALAIVAARAAAGPDLPLAGFAAELRDRRRRLDVLDAGEPVNDIRTVFAWSYHVLTPAAARLFRLLGLHVGPDLSTLTAASLAGLDPDEVRPLLAELSRAHLVQEHVSGRFTQHDLVRVYATDLVQTLDTEDGRRHALRRLLDHYVHTAHAADQLLGAYRSRPIPAAPQPAVTAEPLAEHAHALTWFTTEHRALLAAVHHAGTLGLHTHAWQLAAGMRTFLDRQGHWHDLVVTGRAALEAADRLSDPQALALAHNLLGSGYLGLCRFAEARAHLGHELGLHRRAGDVAGQAQAHHCLALTWGRQGRPHENHAAQALRHERQALDLYRACGDQHGHAYALSGMGWYHALLGEHREAIAACHQALALLQELGDPSGQAVTWDSLAYSHSRLGHHTEAIACYRQALDLNCGLGDRLLQANLLSCLGDTHHAAGALGTARDVWQQALTLFDDLHHPDAEHVRTKLAMSAGPD